MPWESLGNEIAILIPDHPCRCGQTIEVGSERARSPAALKGLEAMTEILVPALLLMFARFRLDGRGAGTGRATRSA
jgi:hypothetical protein